MNVLQCIIEDATQFRLFLTNFKWNYDVSCDDLNEAEFQKFEIEFWHFKANEAEI